MDASTSHNSDRSSSDRPNPQLRANVLRVLDRLHHTDHGELIEEIFETLVRMAGQEAERLDWKILSHSLLDMEEGFKSFFPSPSHSEDHNFWLGSDARTPAGISDGG